jgi:DNA-binding PadR family transcriptional regulator
MVVVEAREFSGGLLGAFLLSCVRPGVVRGRELLARVESAGLTGIRPGEMYRILRGMESEGLIFSRCERFEYMLSRRSYGITASGEAYLEFLAETLREYREEMDRFFTVYESRSGSETPTNTPCKGAR